MRYQTYIVGISILVAMVIANPVTLKPTDGETKLTHTSINGVLVPCVFPFTYDGKTFSSCTTYKAAKQWCAIVSDLQSGTGNWGDCTGIPVTVEADGSPKAGVVSASGCYVYDRVNDTLSYRGVYYSALRNVSQCQIECDALTNCLGFNFDRLRNECFLGLDGNFSIPYNGVGVDHYTKRDCPITAGSTVATTTVALLCNDTFTVENNTLAYGGSLFDSGSTVDLCQKGCLAFTNTTASDYCLGYDFNFNVGGSKCYLHSNKINFGLTGSLANINHYTRHTCVPVGTCDDRFNVTASMFAYGGDADASLTVDDCKTACLASVVKCLAFDFSTKNTSNQRCFLHTTAYTPVSGDADVSQYVRYSQPCDPITTATTVPTTLPDGTTRPTVQQPTTPCPDTFTRTNGTLSSSGSLMIGKNTVDACKTACLANPNCGVFDFDISQSMCYYHGLGNRPTYKANGVDQFVRVQCSQSTTTVTTSLSPSTVTTNSVTTFGCQYNFTVSVDAHAFGGSMSDPNQPTIALCQQECVNQGASCGGVDFNTISNKCWLIPEARADQTGSANGINNYRKHETCPPSPPTTATPCEPSFNKTADYHGFGGSVVATATTAALCKDACYQLPTCLAVDFNRANSECWLHTNPADISFIDSMSNVDHYRITDRCDSSSPTAVTSGPGVTTPGISSAATTTTTTVPTTTSTTSAPGCRTNVTVVNSAHSLQGTLVQSGGSAQECQDYCMANNSCFAVDFNSNDQQCYSHGSTYMDWVRTADLNTTQYRFDRCPV